MMQSKLGEIVDDQAVIRHKVGLPQFWVSCFFWLLCLCPSCKLPTNTFLPYCSIKASLAYMTLNHTFHCRVEGCIEKDKQMHFVIKGPFGKKVISGIINEKGVTVLDRLHRVAYKWSYEKIKQHYHFHCNYPLMQSLLLGTVCNPIPVELHQNLVYTYDRITREVMRVDLKDIQMAGKGKNYLKFVYQRKAVQHRGGLYGVKMHFSLTDKGQLYKGVIILHRFHFKELKKPNIRLL